jgi:hypothetical protein
LGDGGNGIVLRDGDVNSRSAVVTAGVLRLELPPEAALGEVFVEVWPPAPLPASLVVDVVDGIVMGGGVMERGIDEEGGKGNGSGNGATLALDRLPLPVGITIGDGDDDRGGWWSVVACPLDGGRANNGNGTWAAATAGVAVAVVADADDDALVALLTVGNVILGGLVGVLPPLWVPGLLLLLLLPLPFGVFHAVVWRADPGPLVVAFITAIARRALVDGVEWPPPLLAAMLLPVAAPSVAWATAALLACSATMIRHRSSSDSIRDRILLLILISMGAMIIIQCNRIRKTIASKW